MEQQYEITLNHSEIRELQLALLYHLDNTLIPYYDEQAKHWDYEPTQTIKSRINKLQCVLAKLNAKAGNYSESK